MPPSVRAARLTLRWSLAILGGGRGGVCVVWSGLVALSPVGFATRGAVIGCMGERSRGALHTSWQSAPPTWGWGRPENPAAWPATQASDQPSSTSQRTVSALVHAAVVLDAHLLEPQRAADVINGVPQGDVWRAVRLGERLGASSGASSGAGLLGGGRAS
jgi:hypothetical protein